MERETLARLGWSVAIAIGLSLALANSISAAEIDTFQDSSGQTIHQEIIPHTNDADKGVEFYWANPEGQGPWPMIVLVHGHQQKNPDGGKAYVRFGTLGRLAGSGYVAVSVSQPGYGNSDGPPDFCGPFTQDAIRTVIDFMQKNESVVPNKTGLFGVSRGAIVAGMVAARYPDLVKALILQAGAYDLAEAYPTGRKGLDKNIKKEAGTSEEAFNARSVLFYTDKIDAAVFIIHGAKDEIFPVEQAERLGEMLSAKGLPVQMKIFPDHGHNLPHKELRAPFNDFLNQYLK